MSNTAYEVTVEDVENVLRINSLAVANTDGKSFEVMANEIFENLDFGLVEKAALYGDDLDKQTDYANGEISRQLRENGVLEPLKETIAAFNSLPLKTRSLWMEQIYTDYPDITSGEAVWLAKRAYAEAEGYLTPQTSDIADEKPAG